MSKTHKSRHLWQLTIFCEYLLNSHVASFKSWTAPYDTGNRRPQRHKLPSYYPSCERPLTLASASRHCLIAFLFHPQAGTAGTIFSARQSSHFVHGCARLIKSSFGRKTRRLLVQFPPQSRAVLFPLVVAQLPVIGDNTSSSFGVKLASGQARAYCNPSADLSVVALAET